MISSQINLNKIQSQGIKFVLQQCMINLNEAYMIVTMIQRGNSWTWLEQSKSASEPTAPAAGNQGYTDDVSPRWNGLLAWRGVDQREVQAGEVMGGRGAFGRAASARWGSSAREVGRDNLGKNWGTRSITGSWNPGGRWLWPSCWTRPFFSKGENQSAAAMDRTIGQRSTATNQSDSSIPIGLRCRVFTLRIWPYLVNSCSSY